MKKKKISKVVCCRRDIVPGELTPSTICYNSDLVGMAQKTLKGLKRMGVMGRYVFLGKFSRGFEEYVTSGSSYVPEIKTSKKWWTELPEYDKTFFPAGRPSFGKVFRTIKVRLYPNKSQTKEIDLLLDNCMEVYNQSLWLKRMFKKHYKIIFGVDFLTYYLQNILGKDSKFTSVDGIYNDVLESVIWQVIYSYEESLHSGGNLPKYKEKTDEIIAHFPYDMICGKNTFDERKVTLTENLKGMNFRCSPEYCERLMKYHQDVRSATLSRNIDGKYYLSILIEMPREIRTWPETTAQHMNDDHGVNNSVAPSKEQQEEKNKRLIEDQEKKISKLMKHLRRKEEGSKSSEELQRKIAKAIIKLNNQKKALENQNR